MNDWITVPLWSLTSAVRDLVDPSKIGEDVVHYSIPALEANGTPVIEDPDDIQSAKLLLGGGEVLVSRLNPRKGRIAIVARDQRPLVASTEFVALRPRAIDGRFLAYQLSSEPVRQGLAAQVRSVTRSHQRVDPQIITHLSVSCPSLLEQVQIADYLDEQTGRMDAAAAAARRSLELREERVDCLIRQRIGESALVTKSATIPAVPIKRLMKRVKRPAPADGEMVTAFRDGQVTARSLRRLAGFTESWDDDQTLQGVKQGDVVVHGLDGFAGAIGVAEVDGVCSPAYHVCVPLGGGHPLYLGRMLRLLATSGYLSLFTSSTRERAFDFRNWDLFGRIPAPSVGLEEQTAIGRIIATFRQHGKTVDDVARLTSERRQALVTLAVTDGTT